MSGNQGVNSRLFFLFDIYPLGVYHINMIPQTQKKAVTRLHIIQGQLEGLERMVTNDKYYVDIIRLSLAVQKSLQSFNQSMLENHLQEHVSKDWKSTKKQKEIKELLDIYFLNNK